MTTDADAGAQRKLAEEFASSGNHFEACQRYETLAKDGYADALLYFLQLPLHCRAYRYSSRYSSL